MRIIDGKRFYKKDIDAAKKIEANGWNSNRGSNKQWYHLRYNPDCGYVELDADNSGDCYGDYNTYYFSSPKQFLRWCQATGRNWEELLGDIDESDAVAMQFVDELVK